MKEISTNVCRIINEFWNFHVKNKYPWIFQDYFPSQKSVLWTKYIFKITNDITNVKDAKVLQ
jgi:hypothetical protein